MESLKSSRYEDLLFEVVDGEKLRVEISRDALSRVKDKNSVYSSYSYLTPLYEEDISVKPVSRYVYYTFPSGVQSLDSVRVNMGRSNIDEERATRDKIVKGLISLYFLVSEGKVYNVPINPLNYVFHKNKVLGFYREDSELGEITDEWLLDFKKLIAFYLVTNSVVIPEKFNEYTISDLLPYMSQGVKNGYQHIYNCTTLGEMVELYISDRSDIKALKNYFRLSPSFEKPIDLTSDVPVNMETLEVNSVVEEPKPKQEKREVHKKERAKEKVKKQRKKEVNKQSNRKKAKTREPNEAKRKVMEYEEALRRKKRNRNILTVLVIAVLSVGVYFMLDVFLDTSERQYDAFTDLLDEVVAGEEELATLTDNLDGWNLLNLDDWEKEEVFYLYVDAGDYNSALDFYPNGSLLLITQLRAEDRLEELLELEVTSREILFEQYMLEGRYSQAANLIPDVTSMPERVELFAKAYVYADELDLAINRVNNNNMPELKPQLVEWTKDFINNSDRSDDEKERSIENRTAQINREIED